jgi:hypothetical protein
MNIFIHVTHKFGRKAKQSKINFKFVCIQHTVSRQCNQPAKKIRYSYNTSHAKYATRSEIGESNDSLHQSNLNNNQK